MVPDHCHVDSGVQTCPHWGWQAIKDEWLGLGDPRFDTNGPLSTLQTLAVPDRYGLSWMTISGGVEVTTVQQSLLADALVQNAKLWLKGVDAQPKTPGKNYKYYHSFKHQIEGVMQPLTRVSCDRQELAPNATMVELTFTTAYNEHPQTNLNYSIEGLGLTQQFWPSIRWIHPDAPTFKDSLAAVVVLPQTSEDESPTVMSCSIRAAWYNSMIFTENDGIKFKRWMVDSDLTYNTHSGDANYEHGSMIDIDPSWAEYLDPQIKEENTTAFGRLLYTAGPSTHTIQGIIAGMVAVGLSRIGFNADIQGASPDFSRSDWFTPLLPKHIFGAGSGQIWNMDGIDTSGMSKFTMSAYVNGIAYSRESRTVWLSVIVLLVYCGFVLFYFTLSFCCKPISYLAWRSSTMEPLTLAVQSQPSNRLRNATAGVSYNPIIKKDGVFGETVRVRRADDHIELFFDDAIEKGEMIEENVKYA